ncbi:hypothetical protein Aduo_004903 [Ancylostoma duodenale]
MPVRCGMQSVQTDGKSIALFTDRDTATAQIVVAAFAFVPDENRNPGGLCAARSSLFCFACGHFCVLLPLRRYSSAYPEQGMCAENL